MASFDGVTYMTTSFFSPAARVSIVLSENSMVQPDGAVVVRFTLFRSMLPLLVTVIGTDCFLLTFASKLRVPSVVVRSIL